MGDVVVVVCPWCGESCDLWIDSELEGSTIQDCEICCRPWQLHVHWSDPVHHGGHELPRCQVSIDRA